MPPSGGRVGGPAGPSGPAPEPPKRGLPVAVIGIAIVVLALAAVAGGAFMLAGASPTPSPAAIATRSPGAPASLEIPTLAPTAAPTDEPTAAPTDEPSTEPTAEPTLAPTPEPTSTPAPTPEPWAKHTSKRFQYSIQYPPSWFVTKGDATHADQFDGFGYPYVYVNRDVVGGRISIPLTVSDVIRTTKSHYKAKVTSNKAIKLAGGYAGRIVTFKGMDGTVPVTIQKVVVGKGREGYFLSLYVDDVQRQDGLDIFKRMYRSWRAN